MDLPESLQIISSTYRLVVSDPGGLPDGWGGYCDYETKVIKVVSGLHPQRTREVVLHEILHAIHFEMGLEDDGTEEEFTDRTARGLLAMAQTGPFLRDLLNLC